MASKLHTMQLSKAFVLLATGYLPAFAVPAEGQDDEAPLPTNGRPSTNAQRTSKGTPQLPLPSLLHYLNGRNHQSVEEATAFYQMMTGNFVPLSRGAPPHAPVVAQPVPAPPRAGSGPAVGIPPLPQGKITNGAGSYCACMCQGSKLTKSPNTESAPPRASSGSPVTTHPVPAPPRAGSGPRVVAAEPEGGAAVGPPPLPQGKITLVLSIHVPGNKTY